MPLRNLNIVLCDLLSLRYTLVNCIYNNLETKLEIGMKLKSVINHSKEYVFVPRSSICDNTVLKYDIIFSHYRVQSPL